MTYERYEHAMTASDLRWPSEPCMKTRADRAASPELVRRVVLEAAAEHPELVGWRVGHSGPASVYLEAPLPPRQFGDVRPKGTREFGDVRRDTLANLREDAAALASKAAAAVRAVPKTCPTCAAFPLLCEFHGAENVRRAKAEDAARGAAKVAHFGMVPYVWRNVAPVLAPPDAYARRTGPRRTGLDVEREIAERTGGTCPIAEHHLARAETLPAGWDWQDHAPCCAAARVYCAVQAWAAIGESSRQRIFAGDIPPEVWSAVEARARRLGLLEPVPIPVSACVFEYL